MTRPQPTAPPEMTAVFSAAFLGGSELFNLEYLRHAHAAGVVIDAVIPDDGPLAGALAPHVRSIRIVEVPPALQQISRFDRRLSPAHAAAVARDAVRYAGRLARALHKTRGPIVSFGLRSQLAVGMLQPVLRRPVCWVVHEVVPAGAFAGLWARAARRADRLYAYSHSSADQPMLDGVEVGVMPVRLQLDAMEHVPAPQSPPRVLGLIGDLFPLKNHLDVVRLVARLRERGLDAEGLLVGRAHTGEKAEIDEYAAAVLAAGEDPDSHVRVTSVAPEEIPRVMEQIDVLCHLSTIPETFGRVCAEAMAAGRPVIAFGHGAVAEIVLDGETGILCPPGDLDALEAAFLRLHADPEGFRAMSAAARHHAMSEYGPQQQQPTIADALVDFAKGGVPRRHAP